jgi:hypothetical protein
MVDADVSTLWITLIVDVFIFITCYLLWALGEDTRTASTAGRMRWTSHSYQSSAYGC